jgi:hypothetical protein
MKTSNKYSGKKHLRPDNVIPFTRTLQEVIVEIQEIINNTQEVEKRLGQLKTKGYIIEDCWVKNGSIGTIWFMKRKKVYRVQVTTSVLHGNFHKAFCVVIQVSDLSIQISGTTRIRNLPISNKARKQLEKSCL